MSVSDPKRVTNVVALFVTVTIGQVASLTFRVPRAADRVTRISPVPVPVLVVSAMSTSTMEML